MVPFPTGLLLGLVSGTLKVTLSDLEQPFNSELLPFLHLSELCPAFFCTLMCVYLHVYM